MSPEAESADPKALLTRIRDLEWMLRESQETLDAIRRGDADALVVSATDDAHRIYTLESTDRPYQVLIEQMQEGAVTLDHEGTILYCNRRLATMLGVEQQHIVGQTLDTFVLPDDQATFTRLLADAASVGARNEMTLVTSDSRHIPIYFSLNVLQYDDGGGVLCGILTDLSEQKTHIRVLAESNERLRQEIAERERVEDALRQAQKMEAVGQLTGGLAHDFNNLLAGISGNLELLQMRIGQGRLTNLEKYVEAAQGAAKRAAAVTHRLLAFSRRQTLDPRRTDINRLITGMVELIRRTVGPSVEIVVVNQPDLWLTRTDHSQLESALLNLCINARDAMPDGGRLTIETANRMLDPVRASVLDVPPGAYIALSVTDVGTGMSDEVIKRAFDPFYTTKPLGQGTGLGLSMIYGFARQSSGQISIDSQVGRGTTMCLYLPRCVCDEADAAADGTDDKASMLSEGETILVIDDEPTVRMLVAEVLSDCGYRVIEASDGAEGLAVLRSEAKIDLLVTDVGLPSGMNGRQVADAGRALRPGLKVLFLTGYAESAVFAQGEAGFAQGEAGTEIQVLTKPFTVDTLGQRVSGMIAAA